jgi:drug/metabolite transporter (DMT)-like permease
LSAPASGTSAHSDRILLKTRVFLVIVVLANVLGNVLLGVGMRRFGQLLSASPMDYIRALFEPYVALGVILLIVWMLSNMALLSWADLSYVLPVTAIGYVLVALAGVLFLSEHISAPRWGGIALITIGVALVERTPPDTARPQ